MRSDQSKEQRGEKTVSVVLTEKQYLAFRKYADKCSRNMAQQGRHMIKELVNTQIKKMGVPDIANEEEV